MCGCVCSVHKNIVFPLFCIKMAAEKWCGICTVNQFRLDAKNRNSKSGRVFAFAVDNLYITPHIEVFD